MDNLNWIKKKFLKLKEETFLKLGTRPKDIIEFSNKKKFRWFNKENFFKRFQGSKEYLLTITDKNKDTKKLVRFSPCTAIFGVIIVLVGGVTFTGLGCWTVYSILKIRQDAITINEIEKAAEIRQEQLLSLSQKTVMLNETIQNLTQQEKELRIQAGLNPPKEETTAEVSIAESFSTETAEFKDENFSFNNFDNSEEEIEESNEIAETNGQGGPIQELTVEDVSEALEMLEKKISTRQESLEDFQMKIKQRREQLALGAALANNYSPFNSGIYNNGVHFDSSKGLPIIPPSGFLPAIGSFPFNPNLIGGQGAVDSRIPSIWPTTGVISSPYGLRWGGTDFHPGIDIANELGTPIVATADGIVTYAGWNTGGYGNMVDINHGNGMTTRYGHASQVVVSVGQSVKRGQLIAYMGSTGFSTGPHCHYEVHINDNRVNPISYL